MRVPLLDQPDSLLLFCAADPVSGASFWFPPGGGLEEGEDESAAARREPAEDRPR